MHACKDSQKTCKKKGSFRSFTSSIIYLYNFVKHNGVFFPFFSLKISHSLGFIFSCFQVVSCKKKGHENSTVFDANYCLNDQLVSAQWPHMAILIVAERYQSLL